LDELKKASQIIVKADFDGRFKKLQNAVDSSVSANVEVAKSIEKQKLAHKIEVLGKYVSNTFEILFTDLKANTKEIAATTAKSIFDLNLPLRIDKLDANIAGILSAIQNVQKRRAKYSR